MVRIYSATWEHQNFKNDTLSQQDVQLFGVIRQHHLLRRCHCYSSTHEIPRRFIRGHHQLRRRHPASGQSVFDHAKFQSLCLHLHRKAPPTRGTLWDCHRSFALTRGKVNYDIAVTDTYSVTRKSIDTPSDACRTRNITREM